MSNKKNNNLKMLFVICVRTILNYLLVFGILFKIRELPIICWSIGQSMFWLHQSFMFLTYLDLNNSSLVDIEKYQNAIKYFVYINYFIFLISQCFFLGLIYVENKYLLYIICFIISACCAFMLMATGIYNIHKCNVILADSLSKTKNDKLENLYEKNKRYVSMGITVCLGAFIQFALHVFYPVVAYSSDIFILSITFISTCMMILSTRIIN
jgi:hypothetical protein